MNRSALLAIAVLLAGCGSRGEGPSIRTVALPSPPGQAVVVEPHVAVDPARPNRIVVGAQYGAGYNRGGRGVFSWGSDDGGRTWTGRDLPLPRADATLAADAVTGFDGDGRPLITYLYADTAFTGGAVVTRGRGNTLEFGPAVPIARGSLSGEGAIDKGWLAVDHSRVSPFAGTIYLTYHHIKFHPDGSPDPSFWLRAARDLRSQPSEPIRIASRFGGQIAVRADGGLDAAYLETASDGILIRSSGDGGRTFGAEEAVVRTPGREIDLVSIAATNDTTIVCWAERATGTDEDRAARCTLRAGERAWSAPSAIDSARPGLAFPAVAAGASGIWVLGYWAGSDSTEVRLYRSTDGGRSFGSYAVLAARGFGLTSFCPAALAPCRQDPARFFPGDYAGLTVATGVVVAVFALPETDDPAGPSVIFASVVRP
ncbi:MAG: hypothetical protein AB7L66_20115 [Gemmatimonadales bacterium]